MTKHGRKITPCNKLERYFITTDLFHRPLLAGTTRYIDRGRSYVNPTPRGSMLLLPGEGVLASDAKFRSGALAGGGGGF
jgi:hypothetical protein